MGLILKSFPNPAVGTDIAITMPSAAGTSISCTTNGTTTLTSSAGFLSVFPGMAISGTGIQNGTRVESIASPSSLTMTLAAIDSTGPGNRTFSYTRPYWDVVAIHAKLVNSGAGATRTTKFILDDGTANGVIFALSDPGTTLSITSDWHLFPGAVLPANPSTSQVTRLLPIPESTVFQPGFRFTTSTAGIDAGDQYSQITFLVQELTWGN